ncbi:DNA-(apurinic or apyrimidinic site) lyase 2 [Halocaridina rubra]|uniref:DNA-(apurinic or apyrimidinic site) endonuclease n=1 Tax=Halocaridina rubra TaxID=373956 RepID=A0AAN8XSW7_HALRR
MQTSLVVTPFSTINNNDNNDHLKEKNNYSQYINSYEMSFRILSWNVNGLRSLKKDIKDLLSSLEADVICFQETKVTRNMLEGSLAIVDGYTSYFAFSRKKSGYSGVATYCSQNATPTHAQEGLTGIYGDNLLDGGGTSNALSGQWTGEELKDLDAEGRAIITQHTIKSRDGTMSSIALINVYCPRVDPDKSERRVYKLKFYELLRQRAAAIQATGCHVIILGDINCSHKRIDHCEPDESEDFENRLERRYLDKFIIPLYKETVNVQDPPKERLRVDGEITDNYKVSNRNKYEINSKKDDEETYFENDLDSFAFIHESSCKFQVVDTFRFFYPEKCNSFTCWNTFTNARATNYGTRIDYIFCDQMFLPHLEDSLVLQEIMGSDHCPVAINVKGTLIPALKLPSICTKYFPEFKGQQQKLMSYFRPLPCDSEIRGKYSSGAVHIESKRKDISSDGFSFKKQRAMQIQSNLKSYFMAKPQSISSKPVESTLEMDADSLQDCREEACTSQENSQISSKTTVESVISENNEDSLTSSTQSSFSKEVMKSVDLTKHSGWGFLMKGPKPPPLCPGHKEPTVIRTVKKKGPNMNRQFYACARGAGREGDSNAQCKFFLWVGNK